MAVHAPHTLTVCPILTSRPSPDGLSGAVKTEWGHPWHDTSQKHNKHYVLQIIVLHSFRLSGWHASSYHTYIVLTIHIKTFLNKKKKKKKKKRMNDKNRKKWFAGWKWKGATQLLLESWNWFQAAERLAGTICLFRSAYFANNFKLQTRIRQNPFKVKRWSIFSTIFLAFSEAFHSVSGRAVWLLDGDVLFPGIPRGHKSLGRANNIVHSPQFTPHWHLGTWEWNTIVVIEKKKKNVSNPHKGRKK